jgi:hypothetical protein
MTASPRPRAEVAALLDVLERGCWRRPDGLHDLVRVYFRDESGVGHLAWCVQDDVARK